MCSLAPPRFLVSGATARGKRVDSCWGFVGLVGPAHSISFSRIVVVGAGHLWPVCLFDLRRAHLTLLPGPLLEILGRGNRVAVDVRHLGKAFAHLCVRRAFAVGSYARLDAAVVGGLGQKTRLFCMA
jgi:hypothetical protein